MLSLRTCFHAEQASEGVDRQSRAIGDLVRAELWIAGPDLKTDFDLQKREIRSSCSGRQSEGSSEQIVMSKTAGPEYLRSEERLQITRRG